MCFVHYFFLVNLLVTSHTFYIQSYINSLFNASTITQWKRLGEGSLYSILIKNLHPKNIVASECPKATVQDGHNYLMAFKRAQAHCAGGFVMKNAVYFLMPLIPEVEIYGLQWASLMSYQRLPQTQRQGICASHHPVSCYRSSRNLCRVGQRCTWDLNEDISCI